MASNQNNNHHYFVNYSSAEYERRCGITSSEEPYQDAEHFAQVLEEEGDRNIQVDNFQQITGVVATVLNFLNW